MRNGQFEASLAEAKLYPQLWRLMLGIVLIVFMYLSIVVPITIVTIMVMAKNMAIPEQATSFHFMAALRDLQVQLTGTDGAATPSVVFFTLCSFFGLFVGALLAAAAFHFRGPQSLFGNRTDWTQGFFTALAVQIPILALVFLASTLLDKPVSNLPLSRWILFLPFALPLIFLQISAEELVFRGYLQQQLAARFMARWIWMGIPAVLFSLLHWMPQADGNLPIILLNALIFGLIAADLTEQTGSLGAAMGLHFGNNMFGMLIIAVQGTITGLALWVTEQPIHATGIHTISFVISIAVTVVIWRITRNLLTR